MKQEPAWLTMIIGIGLGYWGNHEPRFEKSRAKEEMTRMIEIKVGGKWYELPFKDLRPGNVFRFITGNAWNHKWEYKADSPAYPEGKTMAVKCTLLRERWTWKRFRWWVGIRVSR